MYLGTATDSCHCYFSIAWPHIDSLTTIYEPNISLTSQDVIHDNGRLRKSESNNTISVQKLIK